MSTEPLAISAGVVLFAAAVLLGILLRLGVDLALHHDLPPLRRWQGLT